MGGLPPEVADNDADAKGDARHQGQGQGNRGRGGSMDVASDAQLSCPLCFTTVCLECQRHARYHNQARACTVRALSGTGCSANTRRGNGVCLLCRPSCCITLVRRVVVARHFARRTIHHRCCIRRYWYLSLILLSANEVIVNNFLRIKSSRKWRPQYFTSQPGDLFNACAVMLPTSVATSRSPRKTIRSRSTPTVDNNSFYEA